MFYFYNPFKKKLNIFKKISIKIFILLFSFFIIFFFYFLTPPFGNEDVVVNVTKGKSVISVGNELKEKKSIRSIFLFKVFFKFFDKNKMLEGDYLVYKNSPVFNVSKQFANGKYNIDKIKITLREGLTNEEMAQIFSLNLDNFNKDLFLDLAKEKEGYLFPDTYLFFQSVSESDIIKKMEINFNNKINTLEISEDINFSDVVKMASILEGEASGEEDVYLISGILWKRLKIGMPLQVDVDKNTYKEKGLPEKPLNNPGLSFIDAALNPKYSSYLYYIHDKNGIAHYAENFEEHKININKYLK